MKKTLTLICIFAVALLLNAVQIQAQENEFFQEDEELLQEFERELGEGEDIDSETDSEGSSFEEFSFDEEGEESSSEGLSDQPSEESFSDFDEDSFEAFEEEEEELSFEDFDESDFEDSGEEFSFEGFESEGEGVTQEDQSFQVGDDNEAVDPELQEFAPFQEESASSEEAPFAEPAPSETSSQDPNPFVEVQPEAEDQNLSEPNFEEPEPLTAPEPMAPSQPDKPNYAYEAKLYQIYQKYHKEPTSPEEWLSMLDQRVTETYSIQQGDTLWEISQVFFGDGNYWPKIWAINSEIQNPHLIRPGNSIQFLLGDEVGAPAFKVTEGEAPAGGAQEQDPQARNQVVESAEPDIEIPSPSVDSRPVLQDLPPSIPKWQAQNEDGTYDDMGIEYARRPILDVKNTIVLPGYLASKEPAKFGDIAEAESGGLIATDLQYVYVKVKKSVAQNGRKLMVIKDEGKIYSGEKTGRMIEVRGMVELRERLQSTYDKDEDSKFAMYRALVTKSIGPVAVGCELIDRELREVDISEKGPRAQVSSEIIGGMFDNQRKLFGPQSIVFLNQGSDEGMREGDILSVQANRELRNANTKVRENVRPIGELKVLNTSKEFSTAIITQAWENIFSGDTTGGRSLASDSPMVQEGAKNSESGFTEFTATNGTGGGDQQTSGGDEFFEAFQTDGSNFEEGFNDSSQDDEFGDLEGWDEFTEE